MAGRYQGPHTLSDEQGNQRTVEVFWQDNGWFWRTIDDQPPHSQAMGPFITSTEAFEGARGALSSGNNFDIKKA